MNKILIIDDNPTIHIKEIVSRATAGVRSGRAHPSGVTTRKQGGHGFGLHGGALAAREIGGQLSANSEGPGRGATVILEVPL